MLGEANLLIWVFSNKLKEAVEKSECFESFLFFNTDAVILDSSLRSTVTLFQRWWKPMVFQSVVDVPMESNWNLKDFLGIGLQGLGFSALEMVPLKRFQSQNCSKGHNSCLSVLRQKTERVPGSHTPQYQCFHPISHLKETRNKDEL